MPVDTMLCEKCHRRFHYELGQLKVRCPHCGHVQVAEKLENVRCED